MCYNMDEALKHYASLGWVAQLVGASSYTPKGCGLDSQSENTLRLQAQSPGLWLGYIQKACNVSITSMSLSDCLSLSLFLSLSKSINMSILG